jgi:F-type H+-transporting ATPase subunit delta
MKGNRRSRRLGRQLFQLCLVDGKLDPGRVRQVAKRLADGSERNTLAVMSQFQRMVRLDHAQHTAVIESAEPLTDEVRRVVEAQLTRLHGADLGISVAINPALIGGMRITVGSSVYDGSVRGRLNALERTL